MKSQETKGKAFESHILRSLARHCYTHRLADTHDLREKAGNQLITAPEQPADLVCLVNGQAWFVECKFTSHPLYLPGRNLKDHQILSHIAIEKSGGHHAHCIGFSSPRKAPVAYVIETRILYQILLDVAHLNRNLHGLEYTKALNWPLIRLYSIPLQYTAKDEYYNAYHGLQTLGSQASLM